MVEALNSIPKKTLEVGLYWVKWMISRGRLNCLAGDIDGDKDALPLQPFRSQTILVISPFPFGNDAPGGGLEDDRPKPKLVEGEYSTPFRRVPEGGNGVG